MSDDSRQPSPPASVQDISRLVQTATDAVNDMDSNSSGDGPESKGRLKDVIGHFQSEGAERLNQMTGRLNNLAVITRESISKRPLTWVGAVLAVGILIGLSRRRGSKR